MALGDSDVGINIKISGGAQSAAEAQKVADALKNVGVSAKEAAEGSSSGGGGIGKFAGALGRVAGPAAAAAAGIGLIKSGLDEVAENDRAAETLAKFGVAAEEAAKQAGLIDSLELLSGDKAAAAELYGRVMAGNTRALAQYGIRLSSAATEQERLTALQQLGARAIEAQEVKNKTLTGSLAIMGKGIASAVGDFITWAAGVSKITSLIGLLNDALGFTEEKATSAAASTGKLNGELSAMGPAAEDAATAATAAAKAIGDIENRASQAITKVQILESALKNAGKAEDTEELELKAMEAEGADPIEIAKKRSALRDKRAYDGRDRDRQNANRLKQEADAAEARLNEIEKERNADPSRARLSELERKGEGRDERFIRRNSNGDPDDFVTRRAGRTGEEEEEIKRLRKQAADEKEALNEQRREIAKARETAAAVEGELPNRKKAAELQKRIDDAQIAALTKKKEDEDRAKQGNAEMRQGQVRDEMDGKVRDRERAEGVAAAEQRKRDDERARKEAERRRPGNDFADAVDKSAELAASPEQRARLRRRARGLREGGASDKEIDEARKEAGDILGRRSRRGGEKGAEAAELASDLESKAGAAKEANATAVKEAGDKTSAAVDSLTNAAVTGFTDIGTRLTAAEAAIAKAAANAGNAQRTGGMGGN